MKYVPVHSVGNAIATCLLLLFYNIESQAQLGIPEPTDYRNALYPFAVGNSWTYAESTVFLTGTRVDTFERSIFHFQWENSQPQWIFDNAEVFTQHGDSIFLIQPTRWPGKNVLTLEYLRPSSKDTATFSSSTAGGDVAFIKTAVLLKDVFSTPCGEFDSCIVFHYDVFDDHISEVLCPRIGIVAIDDYTDSTATHSAFVAKRRLIEFKLKK